MKCDPISPKPWNGWCRSTYQHRYDREQYHNFSRCFCFLYFFKKFGNFFLNQRSIILLVICYVRLFYRFAYFPSLPIRLRSALTMKSWMFVTTPVMLRLPLSLSLLTANSDTSTT